MIHPYKKKHILQTVTSFIIYRKEIFFSMRKKAFYIVNIGSLPIFVAWLSDLCFLMKGKKIWAQSQLLQRL